MAVDERILRRAFTEPLPEPKVIPTMAPGYWSDEQHWSPPSPRDRIERFVASGCGLVARFRGGPVVPSPDPSRSGSATP